MKILTLITYTLRELSSKLTLYFLAGISTLIIVFLALGLSSQTISGGVVVTLFGAPITPPMPSGELETLVTRMQASLADGLLFGIVLFGVIATAGIIPSALERGTIDLYLSKPIARWELLLGKSLGAVLVVLVNVVYFLGAVWIIFGIKIGVWNFHLVWAAFSITLAFACLYSVVMLLGVVSQGSALPILGAFLYLFIIGNILQSREETLYRISDNGIYRGLLDGLYYLLPQLSALKKNVADQILGNLPEWKPVVQSLLSGGLLFGFGVALFNHKDF